MNRIKARAGRLTAVLVAAALLLGLASCDQTAEPARGQATPMIVDTDMSSDDIMALAYLLNRPGVAIRAITVDGTGVASGRSGAQSVRRLMRALGVRRSIPVAYGPARPVAGDRSFPRAWRAGADRMYDLNLPPWPGPQPPGTAVRLLVRTLERAPRRVVLVTLGPFTDIALALRSRPGIARKIARIYAMAGAVRVPGNEPAHRLAEWNVFIDPTAAGLVLDSGIPVTLVPLDASDNVPITTFVRDTAQAHQRTAAMRVLATMLNDPLYTQAPTYFWDPLAAVAATDPGVLRQRPARLAIVRAPGPDVGVTRIDPTGAPVSLAVSADATAFERQFLTTVNGGRELTVPALPASRRLAVGLDGARWSYRGPAALPAGQFAVRLTNTSADRSGGFELVIGKLGPGRTLTDVRAVIRQGRVTSVPAWFQVTSVLPGPPGADAVWGVALLPGRYALVTALDRNSALRVLTEITVR